MIWQAPPVQEIAEKIWQKLINLKLLTQYFCDSIALFQSSTESGLCP